MILTNKAKEDFKEWVFENYYFQDLNVLYPLHLIDTLIIEWFDSVDYDRGISLWGYCFSKSYWNRGLREYKGAIIQAIKQANEKYNERFK